MGSNKIISKNQDTRSSMFRRLIFCRLGLYG
jgi:hypothetical protein